MRPNNFASRVAAQQSELHYIHFQNLRLQPKILASFGGLKSIGSFDRDEVRLDKRQDIIGGIPPATKTPAFTGLKEPSIRGGGGEQH